MRKYDRIRKVVRDMIPDIPFIRKYLTRKLENSIKATMIPEEDVVQGELGSKQAILDKYNSALGKHVLKIEEQIEQALMTGVNYQGLEPADLEEIRTDMRFCYIAYGFIPGEYEAFGLESKGMDERKTYVSEQQRRLYRCKTNDILASNLFIDKSKTYKKYAKYYHRDVISISNPLHYKKFHKFLETHDLFVLKNSIDSLGKGVRLVKTRKIKDEKRFFISCIRKGTHLLEEVIKQSAYLSAFNESSVNTVRAISFNTNKGIIVPYCTLRMGRAGSFVDNSGNGGVIACIDYETGRIITDGYDEKGLVFKQHPDTGVTFMNYQMPQWEELKKLCKDVALQTSKIRMIGWDFAHTDKGWVVVEGNDSPHIIAQQMILGGFKDVMEEMVKEMGE